MHSVRRCPANVYFTFTRTLCESFCTLGLSWKLSDLEFSIWRSLLSTKSVKIGDELKKKSWKGKIQPRHPQAGLWRREDDWAGALAVRSAAASDESPMWCAPNQTRLCSHMCRAISWLSTVCILVKYMWYLRSGFLSHWGRHHPCYAATKFNFVPKLNNLYSTCILQKDGLS